MNIIQLDKENQKIRNKIKELLNTYMLSEEAEETYILINQLVENELTQEEQCNK